MKSARVLIIGGGPAGSVCGRQLAEAGFDVTILERSAFPRLKVCGEFVSPAATPLLEQCIAPAVLRAAGARQIDRFVIEVGTRVWTWTMPEHAWALSRARLDSMLLEGAREAGARVEQPASVNGVEYGTHGVVVALADGRRLEGDLVVHADGSGRHDLSGPVPTDRRLIAMKCQLRSGHEPLEGVRIRAAPGAYVGTMQVEGGLVTCALAAHKGHVRIGAGADDLLGRLWPAFDSSRRVTEWKWCGVPRSWYVNPGHSRSFRIGNAAAAVDPVGGEGIGLALWAGTALAGLLRSAFARHRLATSLDGVQASFGRAYSRRLLSRLPACWLAAKTLSRPGLCGALWPILSAPGVSVAPWYALSGKPLYRRAS